MYTSIYIACICTYNCVSVYVYTGVVTLDGRDVRELDLTWLRRQMAIVSQVCGRVGLSCAP